MKKTFIIGMVLVVTGASLNSFAAGVDATEDSKAAATGADAMSKYVDQVKDVAYHGAAKSAQNLTLAQRTQATTILAKSVVPAGEVSQLVAAVGTDPAAVENLVV